MRSTVQIRIDDETRMKAATLYERMGLDIPTAVRMFLRQSIELNGLPFQPRITERDVNGFSQYDAERITRAKKQLDEGGGTFHEIVEV